MTETLTETKRQRATRLRRELWQRNRASKAKEIEEAKQEKLRKKAEANALIVLEADFLHGTDTQDSIARRLGFKDAHSLRKKLNSLGEHALAAKYWVTVIREDRDD